MKIERVSTEAKGEHKRGNAELDDDAEEKIPGNHVREEKARPDDQRNQ